MSALAPTIQAFFTGRLAGQLQASPHTIVSYRDSVRLLLAFAQQRTGKQPSKLTLEDLDAPLIGAFLDHLEQERHNGARTRNVRLAAIHSFYRFASLRHPEHAALIARVLAIPPKRHDHPTVSFLDTREIDALLAAPDRSTWLGRRDQALLALMIQTGLRVSELAGLRCQDAHLGAGAHVRVMGKGRKERATPLTKPTAALLRAWLAERQGQPADSLFPASHSGAHLSRDAVERLLAKHAIAARSDCPTLQGKPLSPHVLRHTCAMRLLRAGVDQTVIALWLGHETTQTTEIYLHADMALKEQALERTTPTNVKTGRYRPPDALLAFLETL